MRRLRPALRSGLTVPATGCCSGPLTRLSASSAPGRDPSAILVGGLLRDTMTLDVVEASIRKRHPDRIIEDVIALHSAYHCLNWGVEARAVSSLFCGRFGTAGRSRGLALPVRPIINSSDKQLRIETLQPYFTQGRIPAAHLAADAYRSATALSKSRPRRRAGRARNALAAGCWRFRQPAGCVRAGAASKSVGRAPQ